MNNMQIMAMHKARQQKKLANKLKHFNPNRMYIDYSSMWTVGPDYYPKHLIKAALEEAGAKNVRFAKKYGWFNLPQVVTFTYERPVTLDTLLSHVQFVCKKPFRPIALHKDWK